MATRVTPIGASPRRLLRIFGMRMAAIFVTTAKLGRGAQPFRRRFVSDSCGVVAELFLVATLSDWLAIVLPDWVLLLGKMIWSQARARP